MYLLTDNRNMEGDHSLEQTIRDENTATSLPVLTIGRVDRLEVRRTVSARSLMGLVAFLVLISVEVGMGAMFGRSLVDQLDSYGYSAGAIGLAAQVIFAMFPVIQVWQR